MGLVISQSRRKDTAVLSGAYNAAAFDIVRDMPGRKKWDGGNLLFETTRANIEYLHEHFPDAQWEIDKGAQIQRLLQLEEDARNAKQRPAPPEALHFRFKTAPRDHQLRAFHLSKDRVAYGLWLEQGLGKTKIIIDNAAYLWSIGKIDTLLIDAPNGVHIQWIEEQLPIHLPDWVPYKATVYKSEQPQWLKRQFEDVFAFQDGLRIFAMHHDAFTTEKGVKFALRVLSSGRVLWCIDESSRKIKNAQAVRAKNTMKMRDLAPYRRELDGTPITKGIEDLYTPLRFLSDDVHGYSSFYTYRNRYCIEKPVPGAPTGVTQIVGYKNVEELQKRMDAWSLRLRSADCLDLPERTYANHYVELTPVQRKLYDEMKEDLITQLDSGATITAEQAVTKILRLQQIVCGHAKDDDGNIHSIPTNRHTEALAIANQIGDKVIVWARFHHDIDLLKSAFASWNPVTWDGRTSIEDRKAAKDRFISDNSCGAFIANPGSAGTGVDGLQKRCHSMIYYSNTFKASERWQSEARLFRDGQMGTVGIFDLIARGTIDVKILSALKNRQDIATMALDIRNWLQ